MTITAQLSGLSSTDVTVPFTINGSSTATDATDYTISTTPITIFAGSTTADITITIAIDTVYEGNETVVIDMGTPTGATQGATTSHTATITDDDLGILSALTLDCDNNGKIDHYKLTFSDNTSDSTFPGYSVNTLGAATSDWLVAGYSNVALRHGTAVNAACTGETDIVDDTILYLSYTEGGLADTGAKPDLTTTVTPSLTSTASNALGQINTATVSEVDAALPIILTAEGGAGATILTVSFSESVYSTTGIPACGSGGELGTADIVYTDGSGADASSVTIGGDNCASDAGYDATFTANIVFATGDIADTISAQTSGIYDAANNAVNTTPTNLNIASAAPTGLTYYDTSYNFPQLATINKKPLVTNSVTSCSSSPTLPSGLSLNQTTCAINGVPTTKSTSTNYTITASNALGSTQTNISIAVIASYPLADTGQTTCTTTCAGSGQDGEYVDYPNARASGTPTAHPTYTTDYTTTDNLTGLVWKSCLEGTSGADCLTGTASKVLHAEAVTSCSNLNSLNSGAGYAGRTDWHLPSFQELSTILNYGTYDPAIDTASFPNTPSVWNQLVDATWTSTDQSGSTNAWSVDFFSGFSDAVDKTTYNYYVRCVSGSLTLDAGYTDHGDGTVSDNNSGLIWQKCSLGKSGSDCSTGTASTYNWSNALNACEGSTVASYSDWRLPNINELKSLIDTSATAAPYINTTIFPNTQSDAYRSSTFSDATYIWITNFSLGSIGNPQNITLYPVRCVRGPQ